MRTGDEVILYWIRGCAMCTRLKGYLGQRGVSYRAVDIMDDVDAVEEMRHAGIMSFPVVRVGERWICGIDLGSVDEFLGLTTEPIVVSLRVAEIVDRATRLLEVAAGLARQLPVSHFADPTPTMDKFVAPYLFMRDGSPFIPHGTAKSLVHHIAGHGSRFGRVALAFDGVYEMGFAVTTEGEDNSFGEPHLDTPMHRVVDQMILAAHDARAWFCVHPEPCLDRLVDTFYGERTVHQLLQTNLCSLAQHTRQLQQIVESLGLEPVETIHGDDLEGLGLPVGVWE